MDLKDIGGSWLETLKTQSYFTLHIILVAYSETILQISGQSLIVRLIYDVFRFRLGWKDTQTREHKRIITYM